MAETVFRGPVANLGAMMDTSVSPFDGSGISYHGDAFIDPRAIFAPAAKDGLLPARVPSFFTNQVTVIDAIPSVSSTATIVAAQIATSGTAFTIASTTVGSVPGTPAWALVPIIPTNGTTPVTVGAIDFGFTTGTTAANSSTVVLADNSVVDLGQWLVIGGAGNSGNTAALITQVMSTLSNGTGILISPVAGGTLANAPIGQGNLFGAGLTPLGTQFGPQASTANATIPYRSMGFARMFDPVQALTRNVTVAAASVQGGTATVLVSGYDLYGVPMTELLTASGTTVVAGVKAFKYITSATPQANGSSAYTVGLGQVVGIPIRTDRFGSIRVVFGQNAMVTTAGYTAAVTTVATNTSGDVRGALVLGTLGGALGTATGTSRLMVTVDIPLLAMRNATPRNATSAASLFGVTQA